MVDPFGMQLRQPQLDAPSVVHRQQTFGVNDVKGVHGVSSSNNAYNNYDTNYNNGNQRSSAEYSSGFVNPKFYHLRFNN